MFTDDRVLLEESLPESPGFVEFADLAPCGEEEEALVTHQGDKVELVFEELNVNENRFEKVGLLELKGCIHRLDDYDTLVKKMAWVVADAEDDKTIYMMKYLSHMKMDDDELTCGLLIGVHSLGNEFRVLKYLHGDNNVVDAESEISPGDHVVDRLRGEYCY